MKKNINVFVYGSLREGFFNYDIYLKGKVLSSRSAILRGMDLYHMPYKGYPAIVPGKGVVVGEVVEIDDYKNTITAMDDMEGFISEDNPKNEYHKQLHEVEFENGTTEQCYLYFYNKDIDDRFVDEAVYIPDGDWAKYMISKNR